MEDFVEILKARYGSSPFAATDVIRDFPRPTWPPPVQYASVPARSLGHWLAKCPDVSLAHASAHRNLWVVK